jgi:riboflavin kinase/FMN adenylyltransferase
MSFLVVEGKVKNGRKISRLMGFPTVNIAVPRFIKSSDWGIYVSLVSFDGKVFPGVTHLGPPKTFSIRASTCETFLLSFSGDLYHKKITKRLLFKIRDIERFPNIRSLKKEIKKDIIKAKKYLGL